MIIQILYLFYILSISYIKYLFNKKNSDNIIICCLQQIGNLNIIFIKIFQWIVFNKRIKKNIVSQKVSDFLTIYNNNVPYTNDDIDYKTLCESYIIAKNNNLNLEIDTLNPINSGSIALIFKAKLNNKPIIIKILKNNIKK